MSDLLTLLAEHERVEALGGRHVLMPNMALACGAAVRGLPWTTFPARATCPACLAIPDLEGKAAAMQRRQA